jgi:hypothetical protein
MWVLGALGLLFGLCMTGMLFLAPLDAIVKQARASIPPEQLRQMGDVDLVRMVKIVYGTVGAIVIGVSLLLLVLGVFVRRGGKPSIISSLVVFAGLSLFALFGILSGVVQAAMGTPVMLLAAVIWLVLGAVFALAITWLVQAIRASGAAQQIQAYYGQLQQQQSIQPPTGYGYAYSSPPQSAQSPQQSLGMVPPPENPNAGGGSPPGQPGPR